ALLNLTEQQYAYFQGLLFDADGNSRLWQVERTKTTTTSNGTVTVETGEIKYKPIYLTPESQNGSVIGNKDLTTVASDTIVAGRLELLHRAYIDGGAGYNILEVDAKGTYAQPTALLNIQEVRVHNMANAYTTSSGGKGYLGNSTYPDLSTDPDAPTYSVLDLSRATELKRLVIAESDIGIGNVDIGALTVVGVRGDATLRLEGNFTQNVHIDYGAGLKGPLDVELQLGVTDGAKLDFVGNADALNLASMGTANTFEIYGGAGTTANLADLNISGTGLLTIIGNLNSWFTNVGPVSIDASLNSGGVNLRLSDSQIVEFIGSTANDSFSVDDAQIVTIKAGLGNNTFYAEASDKVDVTAADGNNTVDASAETVVVALGNGANQVDVDALSASVTVGDGKNTVDISAGVAAVVLGDGDNALVIQSEFMATVDVGNGQNSIEVKADIIDVTAGTGSNKIAVTGADITVTTEGSSNFITVVGTDADYVSNSALIKIEAGSNSVVQLGHETEGADLVAKDGSSISGENLTVFVTGHADLR
ncbi:MAG: hypothetical protein ACN6NT_06795, partial [Comamonas sp.]